MVKGGGIMVGTYTSQWITTSDSTASDTLYYPAQWYEWQDTAASSDATYTYDNSYQVYRSRAGPIGVLKSPLPKELAAQRKKEKERKELAIKRAEELLLENLTEEQVEMYRKTKLFRIVGSDGERYELNAKKQWHNIYRLDASGKRKEEFCIYQTRGTPLADNHLMQKLIIEADTELLKKVANRRILA